jgi:hypothetical protein
MLLSMLRSTFVMGQLLASAPALQAGQTHTVPGQFPTIQAAIDFAHAGDTVLVSDGVRALASGPRYPAVEAPVPGSTCGPAGRSLPGAILYRALARLR